MFDIAQNSLKAYDIQTQIGINTGPQCMIFFECGVNNLRDLHTKLNMYSPRPTKQQYL